MSKITKEILGGYTRIERSKGKENFNVPGNDDKRIAFHCANVVMLALRRASFNSLRFNIRRTSRSNVEKNFASEEDSCQL